MSTIYYTTCSNVVAQFDSELDLGRDQIIFGQNMCPRILSAAAQSRVSKSRAEPSVFDAEDFAFGMGASVANRADGCNAARLISVNLRLETVTHGGVMPHTLARKFGVGFIQMNAQLLIDTAKAMVADDKGVLAMDESHPTCNKRFAKLAIPQTEEARRVYRELLITTPGLGESISGVILFD